MRASSNLEDVSESSVMKDRRHTPEQLVRKLREADRPLGVLGNQPHGHSSLFAVARGRAGRRGAGDRSPFIGPPATRAGWL